MWVSEPPFTLTGLLGGEAKRLEFRTSWPADSLGMGQAAPTVQDAETKHLPQKPHFCASLHAYFKPTGKSGPDGWGGSVDRGGLSTISLQTGILQTTPTRWHPSHLGGSDLCQQTPQVSAVFHTN
jgi:hypothetical protein